MFCQLFPDIIRMCIFVPCASRQARVYFFLHISPIDNRQSRRSLSGKLRHYYRIDTFIRAILYQALEA
ncbi:MAG: hypothetical protein IKP93_02790 [Paludibacteraceae bacterium]|nr:hypothetical protein [Paludibacteraceae bacterium]